ncbi:uncharacterized protein BX663DRAFT_11936 [Cokeromyces recurvatus]|uniref:uncharacterized protein n=1 Tax=Cokeromyces recurvatus TaxID=90255 RepID=UPI00221FDD80|nr:uncharacterized protein BX663DRAFT_11936 [Cokeromyces recurvatus]KAI7907826.1 hypothetical protein BX663DRAFT_11936 [Cokeromyces recurvatus]
MDSLLNQYVIVVSNMKPSKFRGVLSQGMLLAASLTNDDQTLVRLLSPSSSSSSKDHLVGERIQLEGIQWEEENKPDIVLKPKQKIFEQVALYLKTNKDGIATYKDIPLMTSAGPIICELKNATIS